MPNYLGAVVRSGLDFLAARGEIPEPEQLTLVPAPTRRASARLRGGDPVTKIARASGVRTEVCVRHGDKVRDSVGLDASARRRNLAGNVIVEKVPTSPVVILDDVVTTGSTISVTAALLFSLNVQVVGSLVICAA